MVARAATHAQVKIRELARQKDEAVSREDYDTAKVLKVSAQQERIRRSSAEPYA